MNYSTNSSTLQATLYLKHQPLIEDGALTSIDHIIDILRHIKQGLVESGTLANS